MRAALTAAFLGLVVLANYLTTHYGFIPVGLGYEATAGTYAAGATFILRDLIQERTGRWFVILVIVAGAVLSWFVAPALAVASGTAFLLAELADFLVWTPLRDRGHKLAAALTSNTVGAAVDTYVFLTLAGFGLSGFGGQMVGKLTIGLIPVLAYYGVRRARTA